jgi:hypothetical protein
VRPVWKKDSTGRRHRTITFDRKLFTNIPDRGAIDTNLRAHRSVDVDHTSSGDVLENIHKMTGIVSEKDLALCKVVAGICYTSECAVLLRWTRLEEQSYV